MYKRNEIIMRIYEILEKWRESQLITKRLNKWEKIIVKKLVQDELKNKLLELRLVYKQKLEKQVGLKISHWSFDKVKYKAIEKLYSHEDVLKYIYHEVINRYIKVSTNNINYFVSELHNRNLSNKLSDNEYRYRIYQMERLLTSKEFLCKKVVIKPVGLYNKLMKRELTGTG
uniref:Uncharacterized protein n=1 Tax=viral metagenome TaxID=1070528 RepID=A0A6C0FB34_9ZZZZ|tara:strand:+ start:16277 stop:16792 length:516 start_codon:yes stop_codon:yes gene_type:complete